MTRRTLVFSDIVGSTGLLETVGDERWTRVLESVDDLVESTATSEGGRLVKSLGDGHLVIFEAADAALRFGIALQNAIADHTVLELPLTVRVGVHSGELILRGDDISGRTVHVAARISALAEAGEILCSTKVRDLVDEAHFQFGPARTVALRGLDGLYDLIRLERQSADQPDSRSSSGATLLDRARERRWIDDVLNRALSQRGGAGFLEAAAGIGKTALMRLAADRGRAAGLTVLHARGDELEMDHPFGVVAQLLEDAVRGDLELLDGEACFAGAVFGIGAAIPGGGDGHRERRAFLAVLERLSQQHPVVALVDDAHWSDLPSLQWLAQLLRRTEGLQLAVIVAARPAQPGEVGELLKRMRTQPGVDRLEPRPLSPEGVRSLVSREAPEASEALIEACIVATGGNPFLVQELLRSLGREGDGALAMASAEDVLLQQRAGLDRVVLARLAPLGPSARSLAAAAAVFPTETQLRLAAELAELDIRTAGEAADAMTAAGVLAEGRPLRFVHPLTRQAIYDDLSTTQRSELHRKAFTLLSGEGGAIQDIAAHALLIEPSGDPAVAEHLATAAAHARSLGAAEIAVRYLERALAEPVEVQKRPEVQLELGELYFDLARYESGIESLTQALDSSHNAQRCRTVETLSECLGYGLHKWEESDRVILAELERMGDSWTDDRMSLLCWTWTAPPAETLDDAIAHISGSGRGGAEVLEARANLHFERCDASAEHIRKLMERAFELAPNPDVINLPVLIQSESLDLAVPRLQKRLQRAQAEGSTSRMALQYRLLGDAERMEGNLRSADTCYRQALALTEGRNAITKARLALTLLERGLVDEARAFLEGYSLGGEPDDAREAYASSLSVCLLWFVRGQLAMVDGDLDRAERELRRSDDDDDWGCSSRLCDVLLRQGRRDEARAYTEKMVDLHSVLQAPSQLGLALALHARCLTDTEAALAELEPALKHLKTGANRVSHAEGLLIQGETLRRARRLTEARPVLAHARELALDCDAGLLAGRIAAEQRLAGAKPRRTAVTGVDSLTASERRVVELAAAGKTNLEIAGELVLSVRTIEMHLGRVYRKLDITGRTALAAAMSAK